MDTAAISALDEANSCMTHDITSHAQTKTQPLTFDDFYRQQAEPLGRALALSLNNPDLAEDALNEAMARALQRWKRVSDFDNPAGWVYRVAMNWALSWLRRRRRERERPIVFGSPTTEIEPVDHELANAIAALSLEHRAVVVCRYQLDWSTVQTATALDIAEGTVKSRLARALDALRADLGAQEC